jgi:hypothetical protein
MSKLGQIIVNILETKAEVKELDVTREKKEAELSSLTSELKSALTDIPLESDYYYVKLDDQLIILASNGVIVDVTTVIYAE